MTSPTEPKPTTESPEPEQGKTAEELQREPPPPGQDQQPPTNPAGEPQLA